MIYLRLGILEDVLPADFVAEHHLNRACAPESLLAWWGNTIDRLGAEDRFLSPNLNSDLVSAGHSAPEATIEIMLCSRASFDLLSGIPGALGVHLVSTPQDDPFEEETSCSTGYRVLIVSDQEEFLALTEGLAREDISPRHHLPEYLEAYLNTMFHEVAHALVFAENAALLTPSEIERLSDSGEISNDVFDCSTGYGIRPLEVDGVARWADDMDEAVEIIEEHVEALGYEMMAWTLIGDLAPWTFPEAMGVAEDLNLMLDKNDQDRDVLFDPTD